MTRLLSVRPLPGHRLTLVFSDGTAGEVDLSGRLFGPMFTPLRDEGFFAKVALDAYGVPTWPNGADLAPDALYEQLKAAAGANAGA